MKKTICLLLTLSALLGWAPRARAQYYGVRINTLALMTGTLNAGIEATLGDKYTLDIAAY